MSAKSQTVYRTTVAGVAISTTEAAAAAEWSEQGLRVTAETGCAL